MRGLGGRKGRSGALVGCLLAAAQRGWRSPPLACPTSVEDLERIREASDVVPELWDVKASQIKLHTPL